LSEINQTKLRLTETMIRLMADVPMEKISVAEICKASQISRKTFYYHFKDKYDLVNRIFSSGLTQAINREPQNLSLIGLIECMCQYFYDHRAFYANALSVEGQNSFSDYFGEVLEPIIRRNLRGYIAEDLDQEFFINFYTDALLMAIKRWLMGGTTIPTAQEFVRLLGHAIQGVFKRIQDARQEEL
jgi:probable dihydroxyacetone kinase regulator